MEISEKILPPMIFNTNNSKRTTIENRKMIKNKEQTVNVPLCSPEQFKNKFNNYQHVLAEKNLNIPDVVSETKYLLSNHKSSKYANSEVLNSNIALQQNYFLTPPSSTASTCYHKIKTKPTKSPHSPMLDESPIKIGKKPYQMKFITNSHFKNTNSNKKSLNNHYQYEYQYQHQQKHRQQQQQQQPQLHQQSVPSYNEDNITQLHGSRRISQYNVSGSSLNSTININSNLELLNSKLLLDIRSPEKRLEKITLENISSPFRNNDQPNTTTM